MFWVFGSESFRGVLASKFQAMVQIVVKTSHDEDDGMLRHTLFADPLGPH